MFQNPNTIRIEIIVLALVALFVGTLIGVHAYKKAHHIPTGECECCHTDKKRLLKDYHKVYKK